MSDHPMNYTQAMYQAIETATRPEALVAGVNQCAYCGNRSELRDRRGNCIACGAARTPVPAPIEQQNGGWTPPFDAVLQQAFPYERYSAATRAVQSAKDLRFNRIDVLRMLGETDCEAALEEWKRTIAGTGLVNWRIG